MHIQEMHVWFRQYAQQMGMQNVRAILPEQIDLLINTSISDTINQLIRENIGLTNDRIITDNSKLGQINALRTLYRVTELQFNNTDDINWHSDVNIDGFNYIMKVGGKEFDGLFRIDHFAEDWLTSIYYNLNAQDEWTAVTAENPITILSKVPALYLVDLAIDYTKNGTAYTSYYPVRLIDDTYLADTLQDFVLRPRVRTPIAVLYNDTLDIYLGGEYKKANGRLSTETLKPNTLRISYLSRPAKVSYSDDVGGTNVDCDLPENMHVDILKHAVDLYNVSISGNLYAAQQQQQNQNRELGRNAARPDNEGYQS